MANILFPAFKYFGIIKTFLLRIDWDSAKLVPHIELPIFYITGDQDEIIPYTQTLKLHELSIRSKKAELYVVKNGRHMSTFQKAGDEYF